MNNIKINIWGRDFELKILYDVFKNEDITDNQRRTLEEFLKEEKLIELCKPIVEEYCIENANGNIVDNPITNVFKYVIPTNLFVIRTKDESKEIALLCNFKFDLEHGIAIVFKDNKFWKIGQKGIVF